MLKQVFHQENVFKIPGSWYLKKKKQALAKKQSNRQKKKKKGKKKKKKKEHRRVFICFIQCRKPEVSL